MPIPQKRKINTAVATSKSGKKDESQLAEVIKPPGFPIVGIGASAGRLAAFEAFFSGACRHTLSDKSANSN